MFRPDPPPDDDFNRLLDEYEEDATYVKIQEILDKDQEEAEQQRVSLIL